MHVSSSMTTRPPEPMIAPAFLSESKSMGRSMCASVRQPPDGPPICTALNALPFLMPPPISYTTSRIVVPMGTSIRPVLTTLPVRAKAFVPELPSVPTDLNQSAPFLIMSGTLANVSTLFRQVGLPYRPLSTERGGFVRGMPRLPLDGRGHGRALAADERARAAVDVHVEVEAAAEDVVTQQAQLLRLFDGNSEPVHGHGILGADIDVALGRARGNARDDHALDDLVRVALHAGAVHEGAGVALVAVADDVFHGLFGVRSDLRPLFCPSGSPRRRGRADRNHSRPARSRPAASRTAPWPARRSRRWTDTPRWIPRRCGRSAQARGGSDACKTGYPPAAHRARRPDCSRGAR